MGSAQDMAQDQDVVQDTVQDVVRGAESCDLWSQFHL
jgi:hypothetical protein